MTSLEDVANTFEFLGDWEQRYQYLVELGEKMALMPDELKTEQNQVKACMSQVWVSAYVDPEHPEQIYFHGDSDASIIKGVLAGNASD